VIETVFFGRRLPQWLISFNVLHIKVKLNQTAILP